MQLSEVEKRVEQLDLAQGFDLIYELLRAYGLPKASITRLQKGTYDKSASDAEVLWKQKVWYRNAAGGEDLHAMIDTAQADTRITKQTPRFLIVRDDAHLLAVDTRTNATLDVPISELRAHADFFLPWAGIEKTQLENVNYADRKAAEKMALLYDEIVKHNTIEDERDVRHLNIFFSRLLFCFFAEDTGVFINPDTTTGQGLFTNTLSRRTKEDGTDTAPFLDELFDVLDRDESDRAGVPPHFSRFGWVNGKLFAAQAPSPSFSRKARRIILECGTLDWSQINPDIFGSMIQAVVQPGQRENLGMHYTSVDNIMKVIRPLFLDDLHEAFHSADTPRKLDNLLDRIAAIKFFDPACGSGNFLIIAYKELRKLEHTILERQVELDATKATLFDNSRIKLEHFYGIEIDDFAHEVAILSLWLAKHQMNVEFREKFSVEIPLIPLRDAGNVECGNATRLDWNLICPVENDDEVYLLGNPPYLGASKQEPKHKSDLAHFFGTTKYPRNLDYIAPWFIKGANFIRSRNASLGFVSTNSVCQGNQAGIIWPIIFEASASIAFAHQAFKWSNQAKGNAGVSVVIIGLRENPRSRRHLYTAEGQRIVDNINPYLKASSRNTIVTASRMAPNGLPSMILGSKPTDGGHLTLQPSERDALIAANPHASPYIKKYLGSSELLGGEERFCLWITEDDRIDAAAIPEIAERLERVQRFRLASKKPTTQRDAMRPYAFAEARYRSTDSIIVPEVSSERREYIPLGFFDSTTVISNKAYAIYDAEPWVFALIQSRLHMKWIQTVSGRLEERIQYSSGLCYNTFPVPDLDEKHREMLTDLAFGILEARERYHDRTLAQLYDPTKMPPDLRRAHEQLDLAVERLYRSKPFDSDDERVEHLFDRYEAAVKGEAVNA